MLLVSFLDIVPHASLLEIIYGMIAVCGLTFAFMNLWIAKVNYNHKSHKPGVRPLRVFMLRSWYQFSRMPVVIHMCIFGNAIWAITHAPPPPTPSQQSVGNIVTWIVVTSLLVYQQIRAMAWRRKLETGEFDPSGRTMPPEDNGRLDPPNHAC